MTDQRIEKVAALADVLDAVMTAVDGLTAWPAAAKRVVRNTVHRDRALLERYLAAEIIGGRRADILFAEVDHALQAWIADPTPRREHSHAH